MAILSPLPVCRTSRRVAVNSALEESTRVHPGPVRIVSPFFFFVAMGKHRCIANVGLSKAHSRFARRTPKLAAPDRRPFNPERPEPSLPRWQQFQPPEETGV